MHAVGVIQINRIVVYLDCIENISNNIIFDTIISLYFLLHVFNSVYIINNTQYKFIPYYIIVSERAIVIKT